MKSLGSDARRGLLASLLLHLAAAAAVFSAIAVNPSSGPLPVIDLALLPPEGTTRSRALPAATATAGRTAPVPQAAPAPRLSSKEPEDALPAPQGEAIPRPIATSSEASGAPVAGPVAGSPSPSATARANPGGAPGGEGLAEEPSRDRTRYLVGNYAYLRDEIQRGIAYPAAARKMGWEGTAVVAFVILADGSVRDIRIVQGSGSAVLDRSALEAVRNASPFSRPPAEAEIVTPVVYRLQ